MANNIGRQGDRSKSRRSGTGLIAAVLAALMAFVWGVDSFQDRSEPALNSVEASADEAPSSDGTNGQSSQAEGTQFSSLPAVDPTDLPNEAIDTLVLIDSNGPFPFDRDGLTFQNREGLLPDRSGGHYQEFTVITPGSNDRGARRIVSGADGELYYTSDHYSSFSEIVGWR